MFRPPGRDYARTDLAYKFAAGAIRYLLRSILEAGRTDKSIAAGLLASPPSAMPRRTPA
jgi:hypothetical protein